jgi:hypothetical protein
VTRSTASEADAKGHPTHEPDQFLAVARRLPYTKRLNHEPHNVETAMGNQPQDKDRQDIDRQEKDRPGSPIDSDPNTPAQRDTKVREEQVGNDRISDDGDEALPAGSETSDQSEQLKDPRTGRKGQDQETSDRRGDGSVSPSNVRREDGQP